MSRTSQAGSRGRCGRTAWLALAIGLAGFAPVGAQSDDFVIRTTPETRLHRLEVLSFARDWQREICNAIGLPAPQTHAPFEIEVGAATPGETIDHAVLRGSKGYFGLVRIPAAEQISAEKLRFALTAAIVRTAIYNQSTNPATVTEPPVWFVRGLAHYGDLSRRGSDFESAYALWSCARLPGAGELWRADTNSPTAHHPEVAAQLAAFCGSRDGRRERWLAWCRHLGLGGAWEPGEMARLWTDDEDLATLDAVWDIWLAARTRRIFDPGHTPPGVLRRFRSLLLLYPWDCGKHSTVVTRAGLPLAWCVRNPDADGLRHAAAGKARQLALQGAGRDAAFQAMTTAYADVMRLMAAGASAAELSQAWEQAETWRRRVEAGVKATPPRPATP
ncbi:MAG: hypothetical protein GX174_11725 [Lentisphaerae bacterium]|jgi:hypothetical protein|nr:hypothetical protein [Lentisphaerota bacterium]